MRAFSSPAAKLIDNPTKKLYNKGKKQKEGMTVKLRFEGEEHTARFRDDELRGCRFECLCACTGILFFIPLVSTPESRFGRYWANQGLLILLAEAACLIVGLITGGLLGLLSLIPAIGVVFTVLSKLIGGVLWLTVLFCIVYALSFAVRGRAKDIPLIGFLRIIR